MKGIQGLIVAAGLGLLAAALNWLYLSDQSSRFKAVEFVMIRSGAHIRQGEEIKEEHLGKVSVPEHSSEQLKKVAYLWKDITTLKGIKATREYSEGELLYRGDYKTPRPELNLKPFERLLWVSVDSRAFVPELVDPGDQVTFILPAPTVPRPAGASVLSPGDGVETPTVEPAAPTTGVEPIGPFTVASLGNRLGSIDVMKAGNMTPTQERQIGIIVKWERDKLEPNAIKLQDRLQRVNFQNVQVILHPRAPKLK